LIDQLFLEATRAVFGTALLHIFQLCFTFFSQTVSAPRTQFEKKEWSCDVLHELQFFAKLLHGGVCGAKFMEQCKTPPDALKLFLLNYYGTTEHLHPHVSADV